MALGIDFNTANSGNGDTLYTAFTKINNMFTTTTKLSNGDLEINGNTVGKGAGTGLYNTVLGGINPLGLNTTGVSNIAVGTQSLKSNLTGSDNVAVGVNALLNNNESSNVGIGSNAGQGNISGIDNVSIGLNSNYSNTNLNNTIAVGTNSNCNANNQITLGNSSVTSLRCNVQSISSLSDERDKTDIIEIAEGLEFVNKLKPVTFTWNQRDGNRVGVKASGFIAQDLLELQDESLIGENLDLVTNTDPLKLEARYNNILPVLVKAIQELTARINVLEGN
jgi:hypothetical protein